MSDALNIVIWLNGDDIAHHHWPAAPTVGDCVRVEDEDPDDDWHLLEVKRTIWFQGKRGPEVWLYCAPIGRGEDDGLAELTAWGQPA